MSIDDIVVIEAEYKIIRIIIIFIPISKILESRIICFGNPMTQLQTGSGVKVKVSGKRGRFSGDKTQSGRAAGKNMGITQSPNERHSSSMCRTFLSIVMVKMTEINHILYLNADQNSLKTQSLF